MRQFDTTSHPLVVVARLREIVGDKAILSFSRYFYARQSLDDIRMEFRIPINEVDEAWLRATLDALSEGEELALNSSIRLPHADYQLPMVDFDGLSDNHFSAMRQVFGAEFVDQLLFFRSGRSFHAYGLKLLTNAEWVRFMGQLLLCNFPGRRKVVDQRWIGHRLIGGYSALRWSCNTDRHRQYPVLVATMATVSKKSVRTKKRILETSSS